MKCQLGLYYKTLTVVQTKHTHTSTKQMHTWVSILVHITYVNTDSWTKLLKFLILYVNLLFSLSSPPNANTVLIEDKTLVATEEALKSLTSVFALVLFVNCYEKAISLILYNMWLNESILQC